MSVKSDIFKALQERLKAVEGMKWVDKNMGQINALDQFDGFPLPAALIEFNRVEWTTLKGKMQQGVAVIRIYLLYENYAHSFDGAGDRDLALEFFEFSELVHQALQGFSGDNFASLTRLADTEDNDHDNVIVTTIDYATTITDTGAAGSQSYVEVDPEVKVVHKKPLSRPASNIKSDFVV